MFIPRETKSENETVSGSAGTPPGHTGISSAYDLLDSVISCLGDVAKTLEEKLNLFLIPAADESPTPDNAAGIGPLQSQLAKQIRSRVEQLQDIRRRLERIIDRFDF